MIRILIVDDHAIVRQGLKRIVEKSGDMHVVAEAVDGADALRKLRETGCDVVLLDFSMPGMSGIDVLKQIRANNPKLPVLIFSSYSEDQYAVRLLKAGASGYLSKENAPALIIEAVRRVASGKKHISRAVAEMLADELDTHNDKPPHETLSDREYQIFLLLSSAKTVSAIAATLALSVKTVSNHRSHILEKMQLRNNAELMRYAIEKQLAQ
jgi:DNA-binding NarL/FixJ family response regulator